MQTANVIIPRVVPDNATHWLYIDGFVHFFYDEKSMEDYANQELGKMLLDGVDTSDILDIVGGSLTHQAKFEPNVYVFQIKAD